MCALLVEHMENGVDGFMVAHGVVCVLGAGCVLQLPTQMWPWQQSMKKSGESWLLT